MANADEVVTIPKVWLEAKIATLRPEKAAQLDEALRYSLGLV